jgi:CP family cyanate transporter-like MFS transporter
MKGGKDYIFLAAVIVVALNLRPFIAGIGPLAENIRLTTELSHHGIAMLTLIPMGLMGCVAFAGPALLRTGELRTIILAALTAITFGTLMRFMVGSGAALLLTAAIIGLGAAVVQALFPALIKQRFPERFANIMGLYSAMLLAGGAVGAQLAPVIEQLSGTWQTGLGTFFIFGIIATALIWVVLPHSVGKHQGKSLAGLFSRPRTWLLMVTFGLVNGGYSSIIAWLAPYYQEAGWSATASGSLLAVMALCQAVSAFVMPVLTKSNNKDRRPWLWLALALQFAGFAGFAFAPDAAPFLYVAVLGAGLGGCFSLLLVVALEHLPDPMEAGALSAVMQGGGFLLAALAPLIVSMLHEWSGSFSVGWKWHMVCILVGVILTRRLDPAQYGSVMLLLSDPIESE